MRRQREDESGLGNLHDGLAKQARSPDSCTSTRAVGCSLRGSAQILQLKVERRVLLKSNVVQVLLERCVPLAIYSLYISERTRKCGEKCRKKSTTNSVGTGVEV